MINLFILALILFASCEDTHTEKQRTCFKMTLSDALPVQFWLNDCETFNQKIVDGINQVCFCQPFNCDDEIRIQFTDTSGESYALQIFDSDGNVLNSFPFVESPNNIYSIVIIPGDRSPDLCDSVISLSISSIEETIVETQYSIDEFVTDMDGWTSSTTPAFVWSADNSGSLKVTMGGSNLPTVKKNPSLTPSESFRVKITWTCSVFSGPSPIKMLVLIYDSTASDLLQSQTYSDSGSTNASIITVSDPDVYDFAGQIWIQMYRDVAGGSFVIHINSVEILSTTTVTTYTEVAKSDCIDIKEDHDETVLINYSNHRSFAGLGYSDISPDPDFNIRIPAVFFQERFPQEQEVIELSDNREIQLNSQIKVERFLETGPMPFYMHKKLIEILMQQFVIIDGMYWVKGNAYEIKENSNKRYPLRMGNIWLTQQDYIARNIL